MVITLSSHYKFQSWLFRNTKLQPKNFNICVKLQKWKTNEESKAMIFFSVRWDRIGALYHRIIWNPKKLAVGFSSYNWTPFTKKLLCLKCAKVVPAEYKLACAESQNVAREPLSSARALLKRSGDVISFRTVRSNLCRPDGGFSLTTTSQYLTVNVL